MSINQLFAHHASRTEFAGPIAALRAEVPADVPVRATVLLVPGYTGSKEDFAPLLDPLAADGFTAVAVDLPGQYESPGPRDESLYLPEPLGKIAASIAGQLAAEGPPLLLLGHSYGGLVARAAVLAGAPVGGLTLLDSGPASLSDQRRRWALEFAEPVLREQGLHATYDLREKLNAQNAGWADVPVALKDFFRTRFVASSAAALVGMAIGLRTEPDRVDELRAALSRTGVPAMVAAGEHDDAWSLAEQRDMAERLGVPFESIPGAAHSPNVEAPAALLERLLRAWRNWAG